MLGHLFFEHFLQDGLHAFPDPGLHVALDVLIEPLVRGQVCLLNSTHNLPDTVNKGAPLLDSGQVPLGSFLHKMRLVTRDGIISMRISSKPNESEGAYTS